jgi:hypothetical protein
VEALQVNSVSAIFTPPAVYNDAFVSFNQRKVTYEQGFAFNEIQALTYAYDSSINNYTSHYLTDKKLLTDIFSFNTKETTKNTVTTPLIFYSLNPGVTPKYLYVEKDSGLSANNIQRRYNVRSLSSTDFDNSVYVELEFISDKFLRVKHNNGKYDFFLNTTTGKELVFYSYKSTPQEVVAEGSDMFRYVIDSDGYMQLFKNTGDILNIITLSGSKLALSPILSGRIVKSSENLIKINYTFNNALLKGNASWVSYNINKINELSIDDLRSDYDRQSQYLLHTSYTDSTEKFNINYVTLNNDRSEKGHIKRGSNMFHGSPSVPDAYFREYTSLYTGQDQERGNDNISLNYVFFDKDITVRSGSDTYFTVPSSIYPYEKLNINDTRFTLNGSLGGPSPRVSDKIYLNRKYTSQYNNGRYLCTWLSASRTQDIGLWVDRYYYPDAITKEEALGGAPVYNPSFYDNVDKSDILNNKFGGIRGAFFDKRSDLALEPGASLRYERLGESNYTDIVTATQPYVSGFNTYLNIQNKAEPYQNSEILFNGERYNRFEVANINAAGQFTISFDAYIDPSKTYGYQLLGNKTTHGFGVRNDVLITPFIYVKQGKQLHKFNSDNVFLSKVNFDTDIQDVIIGKPLEDFFVVCENGYFYRVNALGNKIKLEINPEIAEYINYLQEENTITFLLPDDETAGKGRCVQVSKTTFETLTGIVADPLPCYNGSSQDSSTSIYRYNDKLYRVPGDRVKIDGVNADIIYFISNRHSLMRYNFRENSLITFAKTNDTANGGPVIADFGIDTSQNIIVAYSNKIAGFTNKRERLFNVSLSSVGLSSNIIVNVDFSRGFYLNDTPKDNIRLLTLDPVTYNQTFVSINRNVDNLLLQSTQTGLTASKITYNNFAVDSGVFERLPQTNFNYLLQFLKPNSLKFDLTLINYLSSENIINKSIDFDLSNLDIGYHTFTYRFDSIQGNATLFVDGSLYKNLTFSPGKYKIQNIFADDFFIGTTGFLNGVDLATYLQQPGAFYISDLYVKNLFLYDKAVKDDEVVALNLYKKPIEDVVLSLPCGQKNNMEEIERFFKYSNSSSSNTINIYLNNLNIQNQAFRNNIKNVILQEAKNTLPAGVSINDIKFINYR